MKKVKDFYSYKYFKLFCTTDDFIIIFQFKFLFFIFLLLFYCHFIKGLICIEFSSKLVLQVIKNQLKTFKITKGLSILINYFTNYKTLVIISIYYTIFITIFCFLVTFLISISRQEVDNLCPFFPYSEFCILNQQLLCRMGPQAS